MPRGDIKNYDELIDVVNNFNPSTGVFTVGNKEDEGDYFFLFSGSKDGDYGKEGWIKVYKNGIVQHNWDNFKAPHFGIHQMNSIISFEALKKGDEIKLNNFYDDSIYVNSVIPFLFTGYKM